ncbi:hypothetical protein VHEMI06626 [[Torrubiella] hemipterigena]|uniref:2EXR domain-containing protein n=1 Tax=[Torrubiella] hemipterigena TaxID=1531966 RepID=A0A0A1TJW4_9HYPO|nr:hypothetical protein VHEMI06626 [[Torrubiella] hemipterigena]
MASHLPPHLQIFTPDRAPNQDSKFHLFPLLPKELRQKIWTHALDRRRIIHLTLHDTVYSHQTNDDVEGTTTFPENGETFWPTADGHQTMSKLFRVNSDSRQAALMFYRVRLPCKLRTTGGLMKWGILYFNPELDFLRITPIFLVKDTLFNFMYHLKTTYDPYGVGLLNLVITGNDLTGNDFRLIDPSDIDRGSKVAFTQIMTNLRQVIFYSAIRVGRQILGFHNGVPTSEIVYNRSFPIEAKVPTFERLPRDPRTIGQDLKHVFIGMNENRSQILVWYQMLKAWGISAPQIQYKWHIAFQPPESEHVLDCASANAFMQKEEDRWNGVEQPVHPMFESIRASGYKFPVGAESEKYKDEDLETAVKPAFGFWLFPVDVLGPVYEEGVSEEQGFRRPEMPPVLWDFSENWPELWVANLPDGVPNVRGLDDGR